MYHLEVTETHMTICTAKTRTMTRTVRTRSVRRTVRTPTPCTRTRSPSGPLAAAPVPETRFLRRKAAEKIIYSCPFYFLFLTLIISVALSFFLALSLLLSLSFSPSFLFRSIFTLSTSVFLPLSFSSTNKSLLFISHSFSLFIYFSLSLFFLFFPVLFFFSLFTAWV